MEEDGTWYADGDQGTEPFCGGFGGGGGGGGVLAGGGGGVKGTF